MKKEKNDFWDTIEYLKNNQPKTYYIPISERNAIYFAEAIEKGIISEDDIVEMPAYELTQNSSIGIIPKGSYQRNDMFTRMLWEVALEQAKKKAKEEFGDESRWIDL